MTSGVCPLAASKAAAPADEPQFTSPMGIVDSGCTICILVNEKDDLIQDPKPINAKITVADGGRVQAISTGLVEATLQDAEGNEIDVAFKDALSVNRIGAPLISVSSLAEQGALIAFNAEGGTITVGDDCRLSFGPDHKLKCIVRKPAPQVKTTAHEAFNTAAPEGLSAKLYRARLSHAGSKLVEYTLKVTAAADIKPQTFLESNVARMKAMPFGGTRSPTTRAFERIHCDVIGPINGLSPTVPRWAIVFKDDFTSYVIIYNAIAMPLAFAFARLSPQSPDLLVRSGISSLTQGNSYLLSTNG
jgi:hypothetical protein